MGRAPPRGPRLRKGFLFPVLATFLPRGCSEPPTRTLLLPCLLGCAHRRGRTEPGVPLRSSAASSPCKISLSLPCWCLQQHGAPLNKAPCNPSEVLLPIHAPQELCLSTKSLKPSPNHLISISSTSLSSVTFLLTAVSAGFQITPSHPYLQEWFSCCPGTVLTEKGHARQAPGGPRKGWQSSSSGSSSSSCSPGPQQHLWFCTEDSLQHIQNQSPAQRNLLQLHQPDKPARTGLVQPGSAPCHPAGSGTSLRSRQTLPEHPVLPTQHSHGHSRAVTPPGLRAADPLNLKDVSFPNETEFPALLQPCFHFQQHGASLRSSPTANRACKGDRCGSATLTRHAGALGWEVRARPSRGASTAQSRAAAQGLLRGCTQPVFSASAWPLCS